MNEDDYRDFTQEELVRLHELSGKLEEIANQKSEYTQKEYKTIENIKAEVKSIFRGKHLPPVFQRFATYVNSKTNLPKPKITPEDSIRQQIAEAEAKGQVTPEYAEEANRCLTEDMIYVYFTGHIGSSLHKAILENSLKSQEGLIAYADAVDKRIQILSLRTLFLEADFKRMDAVIKKYNLSKAEVNELLADLS